ncbi:gluconate:proton symporter [Bifidobacterium tissieri]|uniref:Gluconate:proton symporter n=1 Tax=Bifidobacterium tissieri TaxID=1630162 RepID=A0A261FHX6_9BIFI|nr:gluconate:proton symporter [Bifidobacterium tissieri]OZG58739.1 gluconate:proton symporter [Bifidobacterium tissieri]
MITGIMGILLILSFVCFAVYAMKGGNLTIGFFVQTIVWLLIYFLGVAFGVGEPFDVVEDIFAQPALTYGPTIIQIVCGAWFGRVLVDTGIASSISYRTAKVGEKNPVLATICMATVTCLIFTSAYGVGSAIAIGVILFPIMGRLGVPKRVAVPVFTLSIGAAMWVNSVLFVQFAAFYQDYKSPDGSVVGWGTHYLRFGIAALAVQMLGVIIFILINAKAIKNGTPYEVGDPDERPTDIPDVPVWTYIMPIVPVALCIVLQWNAVPALMLATILTFAFTGHMKTLKGFGRMIESTAKTAIGDIGPLIIMLLVLRFFQETAVTVMKDFGPVLTPLIPNNTFILGLAFCILAPLALFRGPLELYGAGSAVISIFMATGMFNAWFLFALLVVPSMTCISACITQSWNTWSVGYTGLEPKTFLKNGVPVYWACTFPIMGLAGLLLF